MNDVIAILESVHQMSEELRTHLEKIIKRKTLSKGRHYLKAGQTNSELCFVKKGLLRCYKIKNGKEICTWFMKELDLFVSIESFYDQVPGEEYIQALEDCDLYYISYAELYAAYETYPELNYIGRELVTQYFKLWNYHQNNLRMNSAMEKYQFLMEHFPELIQRVEAQHLASFLSLSPVTLSKVKNRMYKGNFLANANSLCKSG